MRADRLISILLLLQTNGRMPARQLAARLEVTERTIYRDVDALSAAGVPVYAERGRHGGICLLAGYRSDLSGLTTPELHALLAVEADEAVAQLGFGSSAGRARRKLVAALPARRRNEVGRSVARIHVDPAGWFSIGNTSAAAVLAEAIFEERRTRIRYVRRDGRVVERVVDPLGLVLKAGDWYLVGTSRPGAEMPRVYRVSRVQDIDVLEEEFTRPPDFDLGQFWRESSGAFERSLSTFPVTLRVKRGGAAFLREVLGSIGDNALRQARRYEDGTSEVRVPFESADQARRYLLGLADVIEVVEPEGVRQSMALGAAVALRKYGPATRGALLGGSRHSWEEIDHE